MLWLVAIGPCHFYREEVVSRLKKFFDGDFSVAFINSLHEFKSIVVLRIDFGQQETNENVLIDLLLLLLYESRDSFAFVWLM